MTNRPPPKIYLCGGGDHINIWMLWATFSLFPSGFPGKGRWYDFEGRESSQNAPKGFRSLRFFKFAQKPRDPITETENGFMEPKYRIPEKVKKYTPTAHHLTFGEPGSRGGGKIELEVFLVGSIPSWEDDVPTFHRVGYTLSETNSSPPKNGGFLFQRSSVRGYVSFREVI